MKGLLQDVRFGLRQLRKSPGFTVVAVLTLALGIGANTAIFTLVNAVLLKTLPVGNPEQLVHFTSGSPTTGVDDHFSYPTFKQFEEHNRVFSGVAAFGGVELDLVADGQAQLAKGQVVSGSYFSVLGIKPAIGRMIIPADDMVPGASPVAVISYGYWQRQFHLSPSVVGKKITLNGSPFLIIGVTPHQFFGLQPGYSTDVSVPIAMIAQLRPGFAMASTPYAILNAPYRGWLRIMARLQPSVSGAAALADVRTIYRQTQQQTIERMAGLPFDNPDNRREILQTTIQMEYGGRGLAALREQFSKPLLILMAVVGLLLLIACANVSNLLLARANVRQTEIAVRVALGAGRMRLMRQLVTESMLIAIVGGVVGLLFAFWGDASLLALMSQSASPISLNATLDARVLIFTGLVCLLTVLLFGLLPALRTTNLNQFVALRGRNLSGSGRASRLGRVLVVSQVSLSLMLLVGAGLLLRSLQKLSSLNLGFNQQNVLLVSVNPSLAGYSGARLTVLYKSLLQGMSTIPGVSNVSLSMFTPMESSSIGTPAYVQGDTSQANAGVLVDVNEVGPSYFETLGIPTVSGRGIAESDHADTPKVAVINQTMARHYFGENSPIGKRFGLEGPESSGALEIIGVVPDAKYHNLREQTPSVAYLPFFQSDQDGPITFELRTATEPASMAANVRRIIHATDSQIPVVEVKTLTQQVRESLVQERLLTSLLSIFGFLALVLATIGLYGLMAYAVTQRTNEIGIRLALGAQRADIIGMVLRETLLLIAVGLAIGVPVAVGASRLISSELYGLKAGDPVTFFAASVLMLVVAISACYLPARRASKVEPMVALRYE